MRVLQLVDSLALGGLERVAVDLANLQARRGCGLLCASRQAGPLQAQLDPEVDLLLLERRGRFDRRAIRHLAHWIADRRVELIHAHGSSLLLANLVARRTEKPVAIVWHDHYGRWSTHPRPVWLYRLLTRRVAGVIAVNEALRSWSINELRIPDLGCRYIPNAVECPAKPPERPPTRPGEPITLACVANLRPQKDHENLLRAVAILRQRVAGPVRLQVIGAAPSEPRRQELEKFASQLELHSSVEFLGARDDVPELLRAADIAVLSSTSEGLPLALLEAGGAALPVVATAVGQVPEVLGPARLEPSSQATTDGPAPAGGRVSLREGGILVPPGDSDALAAALAHVVENAQLRRELGLALFRRVQNRHGLQSFHEQVNALYRDIIVPRAECKPLADR